MERGEREREKERERVLKVLPRFSGTSLRGEYEVTEPRSFRMVNRVLRLLQSGGGGGAAIKPASPVPLRSTQKKNSASRHLNLSTLYARAPT